MLLVTTAIWLIILLFTCALCRMAAYADRREIPLTAGYPSSSVTGR
jgi:hypothetical protein